MSKAHRILGLIASLGLVFLLNRGKLVWAQAPAGAPSPSATPAAATCPAAAASAVAALRAAWPQGLSSAAEACPVAAASPVAAPSPVAAATPVPPLTSPSVVGPLSWQSPIAIDLSKMLGLNDIAPPVSDLLKFDINGVASGIGIVQNHAVRWRPDVARRRQQRAGRNPEGRWLDSILLAGRRVQYS